MAREFQWGDVVKSADGVLYCFNGQYQGIAELRRIDLSSESYQGDRVEIPVAELRRVPDPTKQRPPIEGMPEERPRCAWCGKPIAPDVREENNGAMGWKRRITKRTFTGWRTVAGAFHSNGCAIKFAAACYANGYRRATKKAG